jgi:hypothetical protein
MINNSININEATSDIKHTKTTTYPDVNPGPDFGQTQLCRVDIAKYQPCEEMWNFNGDIKIFFINEQLISDYTYIFTSKKWKTKNTTLSVQF